MFIHLTLVPYIGHAGELKTKPTQHSVNELRRIGIAPDMVRLPLGVASSRPRSGARSPCSPACPSRRSSRPTTSPDIYQVPLVFHDAGRRRLHPREHFGIDARRAGPRRAGRRSPRGPRRPTDTVRIALVGKYVQLEDAYLSVVEALRTPASITAAGSRSTGSTPRRVGDARGRARGSQQADGILIPGGFGGRGFEGKIRAAQIAREHRIPYLGICLGMHVAVSEFARHVAGMEGANSTEMDLETPFPVIDLLPEQKEIADMGGTMRLGADPVKLHDGTRVRELYGEAVVYERHRHRYEVNNHLRRRLETRGLVCSGTSPDERLVEVDRAARESIRSTSPRSTTRSSSRGPSAPRRCSVSSSAPR